MRRDLHLPFCFSLVRVIPVHSSLPPLLLSFVFLKTYKRMTLHINKKVNSSRRHKNYKYICTKQSPPKYMKRTSTELKGKTDNYTVIV